MSRRQELCRNFQRGSCKYGAQCRYLHASPQQQPKPQTNPFGFGAQSQQPQKPNPFGFGMQNASAQPRNAPDSGGPVKAFENKWTRNPSAPPKQPDAQPPQAALHTSCADPESCRQQIREDYKNEAPLWKLTCYAHCKSGPCDISGDVSFEELRAKAYEEARQGHSLQSIVERERDLQNAKLIEFNNLLNNPRVSLVPNFPTRDSFPEVKNTVPLGGSQTSTPPVFSSFSQIGAANNMGSGFRATAQGVPTTYLFGQPSPFQNVSQTSGGVEMKLGPPGAFGSNISNHASGSLQGSIMSNLGTSANASSGNQSTASSMQLNDINRQPLQLLGGMMASSGVADETSIGLSGSSQPTQSELVQDSQESQDDSIWLKERWSIGEIPLEPPPERFIRHVY